MQIVLANIAFIAVAAGLITVGQWTGSDTVTWGASAAAALAFVVLLTFKAASPLNVVSYASLRGVLFIVGCCALTLIDWFVAVVLAITVYGGLGGQL